MDLRKKPCKLASIPDDVSWNINVQSPSGFPQTTEDRRLNSLFLLSLPLLYV